MGDNSTLALKPVLIYQNTLYEIHTRYNTLRFGDDRMP